MPQCKIMIHVFLNTTPVSPDYGDEQKLLLQHACNTPAPHCNIIVVTEKRRTTLEMNLLYIYFEDCNVERQTQRGPDSNQLASVSKPVLIQLVQHTLPQFSDETE